MIMIFPITKERAKNYRSIAKRIGTQTVAKLFAAHDVPIEIALQVLARQAK